MSDPATIRSCRTRHVVAGMATVVVLVATLLALVVSTSAARDGASTTPRVGKRAQLRLAAVATQARARTRVPRATGATCASTIAVPGQGRSCLGADGLYVIPTGGRASVSSHGPDLVAATTPIHTRSGGFGTSADIVCSAASRSRHVMLTYLLPADYETGAFGTHGDRFAEMRDQLRASLYDASALVDRRAAELAPGSRRRLRVLCDPDGLPQVRRIVLPHTAAAYRSETGGFGLIIEDLERLGMLPLYRDFTTTRSPEVRRVLGYYDADFVPGIAGQGTLMRRSRLLASGISARDPLAGITTRAIQNNPAQATLGVQYGTSYDGVPDPPLYTSLLHELTHTMGAVQDETPTSSLGGHCIDGLDIMCYADDGSRASSYDSIACPPSAPGSPVPEDERYDCNGDTYFHPAPPAGNPLLAGRVWNLGSTANETFTPDASDNPYPAVVAGIRISGTGTSITVAWRPVAPLRGRRYEVWARRAPDGDWELAGESTTVKALPRLRPATTYDVAVRAVDPTGDLGAGPALRYPRVRTGLDTSAPTRPALVTPASLTRTSTALSFRAAGDNLRVVAYRVERRTGTTWALLKVIRIPAPTTVSEGAPVTTSAITGMRPASEYRLRVIAVDARGNRSAPSAQVRVVTRR